MCVRWSCRILVFLWAGFSLERFQRFAGTYVGSSGHTSASSSACVNPAARRAASFTRVCHVGYSTAMAPTIVRDGQFRLFFFSREETRIHVHVAHVDGEAKFWLTPQVALANHTGLSATQLRQAQAVVSAHLKEIQHAWNHHFGS